MSETSFKFRQFTIHQDKCAMKVGTDAVLLGSFVNASLATDILDIGTGSGVIALMLAQKSNAIIDAIDIDESAYLQAKENFKNSPWNERINCSHESFQELVRANRKSYDLIVTNPPYFHHASKPHTESRMNARHNDVLTFDEIVDGVKKLLTPEGKFCLILPLKEGMEFIDKAQRKELFCQQILKVRSKAGRVEKRMIMEFGFRFVVLTDEEIVIHEDDGSFSKEYIDFTRAYYLNLRQFPTEFPQS